MTPDKRHSLALVVLIVSFTLGVLGDVLLRPVPWGIGVPAFAFAVVGACLTLSKLGGMRLSKTAVVLAAASLPFALAFAWRDSGELKALNFMMIVLLLGAAAVRARIGGLSELGLSDVLTKAVGQWFAWIADGYRAVDQDVEWKRLENPSVKAKFRGLGRGLALATPIALVFGILLASADVMFQQAITPDINLDMVALVQHFSVWIAVTWLAMGFLRRLYLGDKAPAKPWPKHEFTGKLGATEVGTVMVVLNVMFGLFVAIQFRYLFGGAHAVAVTPYLGYADYARKGFFELLTVVALAIPLLIGLNGAVPAEDARGLRLFRLTAASFVVMLFVVAASALQRMMLYVDVYSLTPLRLYASAGVVFMVGLLGIFLGTTLRGHGNRFAFAGLSLLAVVIGGLNGVNPDGFIAKYNLRPGSQEIDAELLASLSDDAVPYVVAGLGRVPVGAREELRESLAARYKEPRPWTGYNRGWAKGKASVERLGIVARE